MPDVNPILSGLALASALVTGLDYADDSYNPTDRVTGWFVQQTYNDPPFDGEGNEPPDRGDGRHEFFDGD